MEQSEAGAFIFDASNAEYVCAEVTQRVVELVFDCDLPLFVVTLDIPDQLIIEYSCSKMVHQIALTELV